MCAKDPKVWFNRHQPWAMSKNSVLST